MRLHHPSHIKADQTSDQLSAMVGVATEHPAAQTRQRGQQDAWKQWHCLWQATVILGAGHSMHGNMLL